jgi:isopentenyl-diphosphate delta-isomerase
MSTTPEEIFDVVDDHDVVIGQRPRSEVHRLKLNHRAVHVLVFNRRGDVFLQKRSWRKDCFPGTWDSSASGHLDRGEAYDACAVRELHEEIGLKVEIPPVRLFSLAACPGTGQEFVWVYRCESEGPFVLQASEVDRGEWFHPDVVTELDRTASRRFRRRLRPRLAAVSRSRRALNSQPSPRPSPVGRPEGGANAPRVRVAPHNFGMHGFGPGCTTGFCDDRKAPRFRVAGT